MTITTNERQTIDAALIGTGSGGQVIRVRTEGGTNTYELCRLVPIRVMTATEAGTWATSIGQTIASP